MRYKWEAEWGKDARNRVYKNISNVLVAREEGTIREKFSAEKSATSKLPNILKMVLLL